MICTPLLMLSSKIPLTTLIELIQYLYHLYKEMEAFITFVKQRHILEDFKGTFDTSSKFTYPQPSEQQKRKFFEDEFNQIITKFYGYLKETGAFNANANKEYGEGNKEIDQSTIIVQFDTWLELEENVFTHVEKPKTNTPQTVYSYSATNSINQINNSKYNTTAQLPRTTENKPYLIQKQLQSPATKAVGPNPTHIPMYIPSTSNHPHTSHQISTPHQPTTHQPPTHQPTTPHQTPTPHPPPTPHQYHKQPLFHVLAPQQRVQQKQKPYRLRFIQKLSQFLDCPQRYTITKSELSSLTAGRK